MKVERPDLGKTETNEVTAAKVTFNTLIEANHYRNNVQAYRKYILSNVLLVDGNKQSEDWWGLLSAEVIDNFEDALCTLVPDKALKELGYTPKKSGKRR